MSEVYGRKLPYMISWPILIGKNIAKRSSITLTLLLTAMSAVDSFADNLAVIIVCMCDHI